MRPDFTHARATCIHAEHVVVKPRQAALVFGDQLRLKGCQSVAQNVQSQFSGWRNETVLPLLPLR